MELPRLKPLFILNPTPSPLPGVGAGERGGAGNIGIDRSGDGGGGGGGGPTFTWDIGLGGPQVGPGTNPDGTPVTGVPGGVRNTTTSILDLFGNIPWSRIAAFLLGLLLILGGIYLIKPVQQVVKNTVKGAIAA